MSQVIRDGATTRKIRQDNVRIKQREKSHINNETSNVKSGKYLTICSRNYNKFTFLRIWSQKGGKKLRCERKYLRKDGNLAAFIGNPLDL